jgi:hypothetical protein
MHNSKNSIPAVPEILCPLHKPKKVNLGIFGYAHIHNVTPTFNKNGVMTIFQYFAAEDCTLSVAKAGTTCAEHYGKTLKQKY